MATATAPLGPQNVGAGGGVIPFWAASQPVIFDAFTSDKWTPGAAVSNLFQGALADLKTYGFIDKLWLKFVGTGGSSGGTFNPDGPMNALNVLRVLDPNGHAIFDADSFGLYLWNKYGGKTWVGDPVKLPNASYALGGTTGTGTPQFDLLIPFCVNDEIGLGALSDMDASGPYQIFAQGAVSTGAPAGIYQTAPTTTTPSIAVSVGGEFFSLPSGQSRVNGQAQVQLPPLLDRGLAVVNEFTKTTITGISSGQNTKQIKRVGNIISQIYLVARNSSGARIDWVSSALNAGTLLGLSFDSVPLFNADTQHLLDQLMRRRPSGLAYDTGVLVYDRANSAGLAVANLGLDAGLDRLLQTAQTTDLELSFNATATLSSIDVYTSDISITNMVTGEKYSFAYGGQLLLPAPPGSTRS